MFGQLYLLILEEILSYTCQWRLVKVSESSQTDQTENQSLELAATRNVQKGLMFPSNNSFRGSPFVA